LTRHSYKLEQKTDKMNYTAFLLHSSEIRELVRQGSPIYSYHRPHYEVSRAMDYHDIDPEENREDESQIEMRLPTINKKLNDFIQDFQTDTESEFITSVHEADGSSDPYTGLSGDSLAFTLVYVSVFTLTLLYVGIRLARRWRKKHRLSAPAPQASPTEGPSDEPLPPCGHAMCARAARGAAPLLPYTWVNIHSLQQPRVHNTAVCRGRCDACRSLQQPPPSYSKLFEEEQPPQYSDSLVIKNEDILHEEAAPEYSDAIAIRIEEGVPDDSNSDVIIQMENDEVEEEHLREEQRTKNDELTTSVISETHNSNEGFGMFLDLLPPIEQD